MNKQKQIDIYKRNSIIYAYRGSKVHGMYVNNSDPNSIDDIDLIGVYMALPERYLGLHDDLIKSSQIIDDEYDYEFHEFRKFLNLAIKSNPNVLGLMWLRPEDYIEITKEGQDLLSIREAFSSQMAYHAFTGYAHAQLYKIDHIAGNGYLGKKRKELVAKYGYDSKNAAHCIRLLRMGIEFLETGVLNVFRQDAQELLTIKRGEWKLEDIKAEANRLFKRADAARDQTSLPYEPNKKLIQEFCMDTLKTYLLK